MTEKPDWLRIGATAEVTTYPHAQYGRVGRVSEIDEAEGVAVLEIVQFEMPGIWRVPFAGLGDAADMTGSARQARAWAAWITSRCGTDPVFEERLVAEGSRISKLVACTVPGWAGEGVSLDKTSAVLAFMTDAGIASPPEVPRCANCGGTELVADAACRWDMAAQSWEVATLFDDTSCDDCGSQSVWTITVPAAPWQAPKAEAAE